MNLVRRKNDSTISGMQAVSASKSRPRPIPDYSWPVAEFARTQIVVVSWTEFLRTQLRADGTNFVAALRESLREYSGKS